MKYLFLLVLLTGCFESGNSPESAIKEFISLRLEKTVGRGEVLEKLTGKMKISIESMDDGDYEKFADLRQYKRESFRIISKSCQEKKCYVTYALGYRTAPDNKATWTSEVKKIAELQWVEGKWLIADVSNIKTYHESVEAIEVTP
jgi:hypothetical protein